MKKKLLTTAILLTGLLSASTYHYTFKISDTSLFNNSQSSSNGPTMQNATPEERTGVTSTGVILASDGGVDWYGEVSANDLIDGITLSSLLNFNTGTNQNSNSSWLHVGIDGKELFIAKKTLKSNFIPQNIPTLALGGTITINEKNYKVRLLECANSNNIQAAGNLNFDSPASHNSEWNRIMYRLSTNNLRDTRNSKASEAPFINLANYSEIDLLTDMSAGDGSMTICQERAQPNGYRVYRGYSGLTYLGQTPSNLSHPVKGWRPVLEKVE